MTIAVPHTPTVLAWAQQFGRYADDHSQKTFADTARWLTEEMSIRSVAAAVMSPGNSTRYVIVASRLHPSLADTLGGDVLIALPQLGGRRAVAIDLDKCSPWTPDWVEDAFGLLPADAVPVASVLTLASDHLLAAATA